MALSEQWLKSPCSAWTCMPALKPVLFLYCLTSENKDEASANLALPPARARLQQAARKAQQRTRVGARDCRQLGRARLAQAAQRGLQRALQLVQHAAHALHGAWVGTHLQMGKGGRDQVVKKTLVSAPTLRSAGQRQPGTPQAR